MRIQCVPLSHDEDIPGSPQTAEHILLDELHSHSTERSETTCQESAAWGFKLATLSGTLENSCHWGKHRERPAKTNTVNTQVQAAQLCHEPPSNPKPDY